MNTRRWERITNLLERAIELDPPARRELYARECPDDSELGAEVERMIVADSKARGFLEPVPAAIQAPTPLGVGARIGGYRLIRRVAAGGMGVVFEAQQERPNRRVALKLVRSACANPATLRRFRYEAEALGRLRHPGIAQVYEAGVDVDSSGEERPFLAMEFVDGARTLTAWVREHRLDYDAIARLFVDVCSAVQHGHERGVLHRDLKPSNVLVDATGVTKVIDFGIAQDLDQQTTRATLAGELVGSLASMSPEQLEGDLNVLDVRSDVYALGALLYELVCGVPPLELRGLSLTEALSKARSASPRKPTSVRADLPVELEWIVLRALEPDRERRYASAADMARDLERFLGDEPVLAGPPSTVYRVRKFVRRNRLVVGAAAAVLAAIILGGVVALVQRDRAILAKERAESAELVAKERLARIEAETVTNRELAEFQNGILTSADPDVGGRDVRVVDALARASANLDERTSLDPKLGLVLRASIADAYVALGLPNEVRAEVERMRPIWEAVFAPDAPERLEFERMALDNATYFEPAHERLPRARDGLARTSTRHGPESVEAARWKLVLSVILLELAQFEEAESLSLTALVPLQAEFGAASREVIIGRATLGRILNDTRRYVEAEAFKRETFEACIAAHGEDHEQTLVAKKQLAVAVGQNDRIEEAVLMLREIVAAHERRTGSSSFRSLVTRVDLSEYLRQAGLLEDSLIQIESAIVDIRETFGERHPLLYKARLRLGSALVGLGRRDEGITEFESTLAVATQDLGPDDATTMELQAQLARYLFLSRRVAEALPHAREAWERSQRVLGEDSAQTLVRGGAYASVLGSMGLAREAILVLESVLAAQDRRLGTTHPDSLMSLTNLTTVQLNSNELEGAACNAQELVARVEGDPAVGSDRRAGARWALARVWRELGDHESAAASFAIASECWARSGNGRSRYAIFGLIDEATVLDALNRHEEARAVLEHAAALACGPDLTPDVPARAFTSLARSIRQSGDLPRARELAEMVLSGSSSIEPLVRKYAQEILEAD